MDLATMRALVRRDLHDEDASSYRWTDDEIDRHIARAVRELSLAVPLESKATLTTTEGSRDLSLASLTGLVAVEAVEYPVGEYPPSYAPFSVWGETLTLLVDATPLAAQEVCIYYGKLHTLDASTSTIPAALEDVVAVGSAAYAALEWSTFATNRVNVGGPDVWRQYLVGARSASPPSPANWLAAGGGQECAYGVSTGPPLPLTSARRPGSPSPVRTLSSDLLAAQRSASAVPYVQVRVSERIAHTVRLRWERLYTGSEPESHHAAGVPSDGSLLRARSTGGQLYYQRVANPGPGSNFSSWTSLASVSATAGLALTSRGSSVLLFSAHTDNVTIHVRASVDSGATLGSPVTVATASGAVTWMAAALKSDGTALLVYSVGATVYRVKRVNGVWGSPAAWPHSLASVSGLACNQYFDFEIAVAGSQSSGVAGLWTLIYGDGRSQALDTWSPLMELTLASTGSSVQFRAPSLAVMGRYRLFFVEKYTGSQAYSRGQWTHLAPMQDFVSNTWREPVVMDVGGDFGLAAAAGPTYVWLSTPLGVWRASLSAPVLELDEDVLEAYAETRPQDGRLRVVLRNDDGRYNDLSGGAYAAIRRGSQVDFGPGYLTASGPVVSTGPRYWIEGWDYVNDRGRALFVLHAGDAWALLENWRARRQFVWEAGASTVYGLLQFVLGRAGLGFGALSASDAVTSLSPAFTIQPAESGKGAVSRLLSMVPDVLLVAGEYGFLVNPTATQAAEYAYGTEHVILEGRYGFRPASFNRVQVFGQNLMVEEFDWTGVGDVYDRLNQAHDRNLTSTAAAQDRADALLRRQEMQSADDEMLVPVNCGQELYDVVEVTDPRAGLAEASRRVLAMSLRYARNRPTPAYDMRLRLGAV